MRAIGPPEDHLVPPADLQAVFPPETVGQGGGVHPHLPGAVGVVPPQVEDFPLRGDDNRVAADDEGGYTISILITDCIINCFRLAAGEGFRQRFRRKVPHFEAFFVERGRKHFKFREDQPQQLLPPGGTGGEDHVKLFHHSFRPHAK